MDILSRDEAQIAGLTPSENKPKRAYKVSDRRKSPTGFKAPVGRVPLQRLPTAPQDKVAVDPETGRYLKRFTHPEDRKSAEAGIILAHAEALLEAARWNVPPPVNLAGLHRSIGHLTEYMAAERARQPGRVLISPRALTEEGLKRYVHTLAPAALAPSHESDLEPVSPHALPLLIGGLTLGQMDSLCAEIFNAFGYDVTPDKNDPESAPFERLSDALCTVGYGRNVDHTYFTKPSDLSLRSLNQQPAELEGMTYLRRLESSGPETLPTKEVSRLEWLRAIDSAQFPQYVLHHGAFSCTHADRLARLRTKVAVKALIPFIPESGCIGRHTLNELLEYRLDYDEKRKVSNQTFANAVRRVYEDSWFHLDLGSSPSDVADDVEIQMARELISALASTGPRATKDNPKIPATTLLGMALATGIPLGNLIRFAIADLKQRGDTFITARTIEEIYEPGGLIDDLMIEDTDGEISGAYRCDEELKELYYELLSLEEDAGAKARRRWNRKLRQGSGGLWSHKASNRYLLMRIAMDENNDEQEYYSQYPDRSLLGVNPGELQ